MKTPEKHDDQRGGFASGALLDDIEEPCTCEKCGKKALGLGWPSPRLCDKCAPKKPNEHMEREHFDKWITSPPYEREIRRWPMDETKYAWPGQYRDIAVQIAWEAWQERAAMSSND